jgi:hypothetical protein
MTASWELIACTLFIGIGATLVMDLWIIIQKRVLGIASLGFGIVGRWVGHCAHGQFTHHNINTAPPIRGELALGWITHYVTGVIYAFLLLALFGLDWARQPTLLPALLVGIGTIVVPYFVMQPALGLGIAAARTANPNRARLLSLAGHTAFALGLYVSAWLWAATVTR